MSRICKKIKANVTTQQIGLTELELVTKHWYDRKKNIRRKKFRKNKHSFIKLKASASNETIQLKMNRKTILFCFCYRFSIGKRQLESFLD